MRFENGDFGDCTGILQFTVSPPAEEVGGLIKNSIKVDRVKENQRRITAAVWDAKKKGNYSSRQIGLINAPKWRLRYDLLQSHNDTRAETTVVQNTIVLNSYMKQS